MYNVQCTMYTPKKTYFSTFSEKARFENILAPIIEIILSFLSDQISI